MHYQLNYLCHVVTDRASKRRDTLVGKDATFVETDGTIGGVTIDTTKMVSLVGPTEVDWRDGLARMVAARD